MLETSGIQVGTYIHMLVLEIFILYSVYSSYRHHVQNLVSGSDDMKILKHECHPTKKCALGPISLLKDHLGKEKLSGYC